jgi:beta-glucosidase
VCTINEANMGLQLAALIKDMMKRMSSDVQVGINMRQGGGGMELAMKETAEAFGCDPRKVNTFLSMRTPEGDRLVMRAHEAARDAMKSVCPHLKVGLTLSLHDFQALDGGEANAAKEWDDELLHYLPYIEHDDFLGVQCYTRKLIGPDGVVQPSADAPRTQMGYEDYPPAIGNVIRKVSESFKGDLIITENGIATSDDARRVEFIRDAFNSVKEAIADGVPVKGYMYWSLLDNFEWQLGFEKTFGLIAVDRKTQRRIPKESLYFLARQR